MTENRPNHQLRFGGYEVKPIRVDTAKIVVLPLCYEHTPSYGTGAGQGPIHVLEASEQLEALDEQTLANWTQFDIATVDTVYPTPDPEKAMEEMTALARPYLENKQFLLSLGGDHAISFGPIRAASQVYPDLGVLQIDAHLDLRNEWNGSRFNHACVMRRVVEDLGKPVVPVGIRSICAEELQFIKQRHLSPFYAHDLEVMGNHWMKKILEMLPETVYLSIDLDGLDPSVIPGTGTPEPGGLTYRQLIQLIQALGSNKKVIAADITELAKIPGTQVSEFTAAKIAMNIMVHCTDVGRTHWRRDGNSIG